MVAHASVVSSKHKVGLDSHADTCLVGDNCLVIYDHYRPVNVYHYDPKYGHRSAKTVDAAVGYQDPKSGQKFILINQAIWIDGFVNHLNGMHISEVLKFLAETPYETPHAIELVDPFNAPHLLIILHQLSSVTSYFDVFSPSITDYEDGDIPTIHLTLEEPLWNPSTGKNSEQEIQMLDHRGQISIPATAARGEKVKLH